MATKRLNVSGFVSKTGSATKGLGKIAYNSAEYFVAETSIRRQLRSSGTGRLMTMTSSVTRLADVLGENKRIKARLGEENLGFLRSAMLQNNARKFADGSRITGYSETIAEEITILNSNGKLPRSVRKKLKSLDFNNPVSRIHFIKQMKKRSFYNSAAKTDFSHKAQFIDTIDPDEVGVYLAMCNNENFVKTVKAFEKQIKKSPDLSQALKEHKLHRHVLKKIASGKIDVDAIKQSGTLCGTALSHDDLVVLDSLKIIANYESISFNNENELLKNLGYTSKMQSLDLSSLKDVKLRIKEFESGLSSVNVQLYNKHKTKLSELRSKDVRKLVKTASEKGGLTDNEIKGLEEYAKLKEHASTLMQQKGGTGRKLGAGLNTWRTLTHDNSEFMQGVMQVRNGIHLSKLGLKLGIKAGKVQYKVLNRIAIMPSRSVFRFLSPRARKGFSRTAKFIQNHAPKTYSAASSAVNGIANSAQAVTRTVKKGAGAAKNIVTLNGRTTSAHKKVKDWNKARKKAKKAKNLAKKQNALKKGAKSVKKMLSGVKKFVLKAGVAVVLGYIVIILSAALLRGVLTPIAVIDDFLFGWTDDIDWPWDLTEETKKSYFLAVTKQMIKDEQQFNTAAANLEKEEKEKQMSFYSLIDLNDGFQIKKYSVDSTSYGERNVKYIWMNDVGARTYVPTNQYSNVKLVISMAHAFTFPIDGWDDCNTFSKYAIGMWRHLNEIDIKGEVTFASELTQPYHYFCCPTYNAATQKTEYDPIYSYLGLKYNEGDTININSQRGTTDKKIATQYDHFAYVGGEMHTKTEKGCVHTTYDGYTGVGKSVTDNGSTKPNLYTSLTHLSEACSETDKYIYQIYHDDVIAEPLKHGYKVPGENITAYYELDPLIPQACLESSEFYGIIGVTKENTQIRNLYKDIEICGESNGRSIGRCTNTALIHCDGCIHTTEYHSTQSVTLKDGTVIDHVSQEICGCGNSMIIHTLYECQGHPIILYHGNGAYITDANGERHFICGAECDNPVIITDYIGNTFTCCPGHQTGIKYCSEHYLTEPCEYSSESVWYECPGIGKDTCPGHTVCRGHYTGCEGHDSCSGHYVLYNPGKITYIFKDTMHGIDDESYLFGDWSYTLTEKVLWWEKDTVISPDSLADPDEFKGWYANDGEAKSLMEACFGTDWYEEYGISGRSFKGGTISPAEIEDIMKSFNITEITYGMRRYDTVLYALRSVGRIPYYPGGKTVIDASYYNNNFGTLVETIEENSRVYSVYGLCKEAYPDLIIWGGHEMEKDTGVYSRSPNLSYRTILGTGGEFPYITDAEQNKYPFENQKKPGDVVVYVSDVEITEDFAPELSQGYFEDKVGLSGGTIPAGVRDKEFSHYSGQVGIFIGYQIDSKGKKYMLIATMDDSWSSLAVVEEETKAANGTTLASWRKVTGVFDD